MEDQLNDHIQNLAKAVVQLTIIPIVHKGIGEVVQCKDFLFVFANFTKEIRLTLYFQVGCTFVPENVRKNRQIQPAVL